MENLYSFPTFMRTKNLFLLNQKIKRSHQSRLLFDLYPLSFPEQPILEFFFYMSTNQLFRGHGCTWWLHRASLGWLHWNEANLFYLFGGKKKSVKNILKQLAIHVHSKQFNIYRDFLVLDRIHSAILWKINKPSLFRISRECSYLTVKLSPECSYFMCNRALQK